MSLNMNDAPKPAGKDYGLAALGVQAARLVSIIETGEQPREYKGEEKPPAVQLNFTFELPGDLISIEDAEGNVTEKPRWISMNNINFFTDEKAKLVEIVKALDPSGASEGNLAELIGQPCFLTIEHKEYKGKPYAKAVSISGVPSGMAVPDLVNEPRVFDWSAPSKEVWDTLPAFIKEKIQHALNYKGSTVEAMVNGEVPDAAETPAEDFDDDIPF